MDAGVVELVRPAAAVEPEVELARLGGHVRTFWRDVHVCLFGETRVLAPGKVMCLVERFQACEVGRCNGSLQRRIAHVVQDRTGTIVSTVCKVAVRPVIRPWHQIPNATQTMTVQQPTQHQHSTATHV